MKLGSAEFKALERVWYDKLKATGHCDVEYSKSSTPANPWFIESHILRTMDLAIRAQERQADQLFRIMDRHLANTRFATRGRRLWVVLAGAGWNSADLHARFPRGASRGTITKFLATYKAAAVKRAAADVLATDERAGWADADDA